MRPQHPAPVLTLASESSATAGSTQCSASVRLASIALVIAVIALLLTLGNFALLRRRS